MMLQLSASIKKVKEVALQVLWRTDYLEPREVGIVMKPLVHRQIDESVVIPPGIQSGNPRSLQLDLHYLLPL